MNYYDTATTTTGNLDPGAVFAMFSVLLLPVLIFSIGFFVIYGYFMSKIFQKLNLKNPWAAWVPVYGQIKFLQAGDQNPYFILLNLIPFVGSFIFLVFTIMAALKIGQKFGKESSYVVLFIFLGWLWMILLGSKNVQPINAQATPAATQPAAEDQTTPPTPEPQITPQPPVAQDTTVPSEPTITPASVAEPPAPVPAEPIQPTPEPVAAAPAPTIEPQPTTVPTPEPTPAPQPPAPEISVPEAATAPETPPAPAEPAADSAPAPISPETPASPEVQTPPETPTDQPPQISITA